MIVFLPHRRGSTRGARLNALIVGAIVAALGSIIKSLLPHGWGDQETASGAAVRPLWMTGANRMSHGQDRNELEAAMGTIYRHTQVSRATIAVLVVVWAAAVWWSIRGSQSGLVAVTLLSGALLATFSTLTVIVRDQALHVFFGPGLPRRRIPLGRVRDVRTVRTAWYYGWGIRWTPFGWLWNVSGLGGVEVRFEDGRLFRIGSDEPDKLADVLRRQLRAV